MKELSIAFRKRSFIIVVSLLFFVSGWALIVYQVLWIKQLFRNKKPLLVQSRRTTHNGKMLRNTESDYAPVAVVLHWLTAIVIIGLFILGLWMVDLDYYNKWYKLAPDIHRSIGVLLAITVLLRLALNLLSPTPKPEPNIKPWEHVLARSMHGVLYLFIFAIAMTGYLISTADGRSVDVFGWFSVPATITGMENQEDLAGKLHYYFAVTILVLAGLHALAALKHHFIDRDNTLKRMLMIRRPK